MRNLKMRNCCLSLLAAALFLGVMAPGLSLAITNLTVDSSNSPFTESGSNEYYTGIIGDNTGAGTYINNAYSVAFHGPSGLDLGSYPGGTGTIYLNSPFPPGGTGSITVDYSEIIGDQANGTFYQGGGTNTVGTNLQLGYNSGVTGAYNQTGGSLSVTGNEYVGYSGTGIFTQSGGGNTMTSLYLGYNAGSSSSYTLSGIGILSAGNEYVGYSGTGAFIQNLGANKVTNSLYLGYIAGGSGTYTLNGGVLDPANEYVGYSGAGAFTQSGGTNTVTGSLYLGYNAGGSGSYTLNDGGLIAAVEFIGGGGTGTFTQSGGTNAVAGLVVGTASSSGGAYTLSGGGLIAGLELIGGLGTGTFTQSGGTNAVAGLVVGTAKGSGGAYTLSDGGLIAGLELIGGRGTGTFTQSGGTNVVVGGLVVGAGSGGSGSYNLSGGSLSAANEYVGYNGTGAFTQSGGTNTVTTLTVAANSGSSGTYTLSNGDLTAGAVNLNTGGTFNYKAGTFSGNLSNNSGIVNIGPGAGSGTTLNFSGNYTQGSGGLLNIKIFGPGSYDNMVVTGAANLGGKVDLIVEPGYLPHANTVFQIITAGSIIGSLTPAYAQLPNSQTLFWTTKISDPGLDLTVTRDYTNPALDLNFKQFAVGTMLNGVAATATGDLNYVLNVIDYLPTAGAVGNALQQISPDKAQALSDLSITAVRAETQSLSRRMTNLRYDIDDMGGAGAAGSYNLGGWSLFGDPSGFAGTRSTTMDRTGYDFSGEGFTMGIDRKVADNLLLGLAAGYTHANASFSGSGGSADLDLVPISLYAAYMPQSFYIFGTAGYALNLYDLDRQISFSSMGGSVSRVASSSPVGNLFNVYGEAGYDVKVKPVVVTPMVSVGYSHLGIDGFTETGAGSLDLNVSNQSIDSAQSGIGVKVAAPYTSGGMKVVPQAYATWQHEFCDGKQDINAGLAQGSSTFGWETEGARRDFANVGGDVSMFIRKDLSVHISYNAEVGGGGDTTHILSAGLRWQF